MAPSGLDGQPAYPFGPMGPPPQQQSAGTFPRGKKSQCESPTYSFSTLSPTSMSSASGSSYSSSSSSSSSTTVSYRKRAKSESSILGSKAGDPPPSSCQRNNLSLSSRLTNGGGKVYAKENSSCANSDQHDRIGQQQQQLSVVASGLTSSLRLIIFSLEAERFIMNVSTSLLGYILSSSGSSD